MSDTQKDTHSRIGTTRRRFIGGLAAGAAAVLAACGRSVEALPELNEYQEGLLQSDAIARAASTRPTGLLLPTQPISVAFVQSAWGPRGNDYRSLIARAGTGDEEVVRLNSDPLGFPEEITLGQMIASFPSSKPVDLIIFPVSQLRDLEENGTLIPMDKVSSLGHLLDANAYWGDSLAAGQIRGRQMAIPLMLGPWVLMFNRRRLGEYGIKLPGPDPWDMEQFLENVARMTFSSAGADRPDAFGFLQMVTAEGGQWPVPPSWVWLTSAGAALPGLEGGEEDLVSDAALRALDLMHGLAYEQRSSYNISGGNSPHSWRQMRGVLSDPNNGMMSFPANSGWFLSAWRKEDGNGGGFDLAPLPGGRGHRTPTEIHMMIGLLASSHEPEAAILGLMQIYESIGDAMFPTAMKADVERMRVASRSIRDEDVEALTLALNRSRAIQLTGADRGLMINTLDRPVFLQKAEPEDAAEAARIAFEEMYFYAG
ncbi:MAG: extracellular solute-binding protein [Chloroflexota bacterium]|nr:extracellular solute-binding protein [Chloroflexota bacterium]